MTCLRNREKKIIRIIFNLDNFSTIYGVILILIKLIFIKLYIQKRNAYREMLILIINVY